jgi:hypothetical protein
MMDVEIHPVFVLMPFASHPTPNALFIIPVDDLFALAVPILAEPLRGSEGLSQHVLLQYLLISCPECRFPR